MRSEWGGAGETDAPGPRHTSGVCASRWLFYALRLQFLLSAQNAGFAKADLNPVLLALSAKAHYFSPVSAIHH